MGPFDDEETRVFYCDIPDFLSMIPPALLGYAADEIEKLRAANILRFKSADLSADMDESLSFNTDTDAFSSSGDGLEDGAGSSTDENTVVLNDKNGDCNCQRLTRYFQ